MHHISCIQTSLLLGKRLLVRMSCLVAMPDHYLFVVYKPNQVPNFALTRRAKPNCCYDPFCLLHRLQAARS